MTDADGKATYERHKRAQLGADYPNAAPFEELDQREQEAWGRSAGKVLTPAEVADAMNMWREEGLCARTHLLCDSHEALRAELDRSRKEAEVYRWAVGVKDKQIIDIDDYLMDRGKELARLRGLIEGMGHEAHCNIKWRDAFPNASVQHCNCIQSKVNL